MPVNLEWSVPHTIVSPEGSLDLNTPGWQPLESEQRPLFLLKPNPYQITPSALRAVADNLSQADGSSLQPPFIPGLTASLYVEYWVTPTGDPADPRREPACEGDLREMDERLMLHLNALRSFSTDPNTMQRLLWTPTGYGDRRMLTAVLLAGWPQPQWFSADGGRGVGVSFGLATPFPYAIDATEIATSITGGTSAPIGNTGNASQSPVVRAYGPSTEFVIENLDTGAAVSYDSARPGASAIASGHYAEVNFFTGSIYLDGDGVDLIAGLDPTVTDFFLLEPGSQTIAATGADIVVLSNNVVV